LGGHELFLKPKDIKEIQANCLSWSLGLDNIFVPPKNTKLNKTTKPQATCFTFGVIESVKHEFQEDLWDEIVQPSPIPVCGLYHVPMTKGRMNSEVCVPMIGDLYDATHSLWEKVQINLPPMGRAFPLITCTFLYCHSLCKGAMSKHRNMKHIQGEANGNHKLLRWTPIMSSSSVMQQRRIHF
jgi:hypothetical protein